MEIDNARQLVNQAEEAFVAAKQALDNPDNDQQKTTLVNKAALLTLRTTAGLLEDVGDRLQALETTVHDKPSKQEVEHMLEAYASESQKAQVRARCYRRPPRAHTPAISPAPPTPAPSQLCSVLAQLIDRRARITAHSACAGHAAECHRPGMLPHLPHAAQGGAEGGCQDQGAEGPV